MQCIVLYCILGFCYGLHRIKIFLFCWLRKHAILLIIKKIGLPKIKCPFLCLSSLIVTLLCFCWYFLTCPFWHANVKSIVKKESFFKKCLWRPMFLERLGRWCQWLWIHCVQNYFLKIFQPKECTKSNFCDNKKKKRRKLQSLWWLLLGGSAPREDGRETNDKSLFQPSRSRPKSLWSDIGIGNPLLFLTNDWLASLSPLLLVCSEGSLSL